MRIAEQCNTARFERNGKRNVAPYVPGALPWQSVHQVEIDPLDGEVAQRQNRFFHQFVRLNATDRLLDMGGKILNPEAGAVHPYARERASERTPDMPRVELDCVLAQACEIESIREAIPDLDERAAAQHGRRPASPMEVRDL